MKNIMPDNGYPPINTISFNNKYQRHGYWKVYLDGYIIKGKYFNDYPIGYFERYTTDGKQTMRTYHLI